MALKLEWTERAIEHIVEILEYWEERNGSKTYSIKLYSWVETTLAILTKHPESGRITDNNRLYKKIVKDYFIYYTFDTEILTVIAIIDMRRDPDFIQDIENESK